MDFDSFISRFNDSQARKESFMAFIRGSSSYSGRAEAFLDIGDRILIVKQDGVLLIHQPEGNSSVHYLKSGSLFSIEVIDDALLFKARNDKEFVDVKIVKVYNVISRRLEDGAKQVIFGTESDMSDMIKENPSLISPDFKPLSREEHTKVGFIDVFGHDGAGNLVVVECKRFSASLSCVTQLRRYVERIKKIRGVNNVKGVMASPSITPNALELLKEWGFSWVRVEPPKRLERFNKYQRLLDDF